MTTSIHCSIVSAEQEIFAGTVQRVVATGSLGDIGVYPGHTPLLTGIQPGPVKLTMEDGSEEEPVKPVVEKFDVEDVPQDIDQVGSDDQMKEPTQP